MKHRGQTPLFSNAYQAHENPSSYKLKNVPCFLGAENDIHNACPLPFVIDPDNEFPEVLAV